LIIKFKAKRFLILFQEKENQINKPKMFKMKLQQSRKLNYQIMIKFYATRNPQCSKLKLMKNINNWIKEK